MTWKITPYKSKIQQIKREMYEAGFIVTSDQGYVHCTEKTQITLPYKVKVLPKEQLGSVKGSNDNFIWFTFENELLEERPEQYHQNNLYNEDGWGGL